MLTRYDFHGAAMTHTIPGRLRAPPGPVRAPRAVRIALCVAAFTVVLAALSGAAGAACVCRCLNGKAQPVCSSSTDIPPLCNTTACPMSPPRVSPQDALQPKPAVKPGCRISQVYNPDTGRHEWGQICR
jgi:hypothetical protein